MSSVIFHPKDDIFISNSEDKTTRVWDFNKKTLVDTFTNKEFDRFWIVSAHPDNYYFASGSDSSLYVFTLFKDRIPLVKVTENYICHAYKKQLKVIDLKSGSTSLIKEFDVGENILQDNITQVLYNVYDPSRTQILVRLGTTKYSLLFNNQQKELFNAKGAAFVGKNKLVRVNEHGIMELYNYEQNQQNTFCATESVVSLFMLHGGKLIA